MEGDERYSEQPDRVARVTRVTTRAEEALGNASKARQTARFAVSAPWIFWTAMREPEWWSRYSVVSSTGWARRPPLHVLEPSVVNGSG